MLKGPNMIIIILILLVSNIATKLLGIVNEPVNISAQVWVDHLKINNYLGSSTVKTYNKHNISYNIPYEKFLIGNMALKAYSQENPQLKVSHPLIRVEDSYFHNYTEVNSQIGFEFYISDNEVISRVDYHTRAWQENDSEYLTYHYPAAYPLPQAAMQILDKRIESFFSYFPQQKHDLDSLRIRKLDYFYCPDLESIELLTSYKTRGIFLLNQDYIVSTYPAHFHEVTHFLINYYLQSNQLFTHTFLQEGLAVAIGGRGGQSREGLMLAGKFLLDTGMVNYSDFYDVEKFRAEHPSISYPVAGLLTRVMLDHYSPEEYLALYKKYSNSSGNFSEISELGWLTKDIIDEYVENNSFRSIFFHVDETDFKPIYTSENLQVSLSNERLKFKTKSSVVFDFQNKVFIESENGRYSLTCSSEEIKLEDNLLAEIISSWSLNFTLSDEAIPFENGYYIFYLNQDVLSLTQMVQ
jgi:hypothetical protein